MATRQAHARREGNLKNGKGRVDFERAVLSGPGAFASRLEEVLGRNPEELLGAAHASGLAMTPSLALSEAGFKPDDVDATANVAVRLQDVGFKIPGLTSCARPVPRTSTPRPSHGAP